MKNQVDEAVTEAPAHTVLGVRDSETAQDTWWFRIGGDKWVLIAGGVMPDRVLTSTEFLAAHVNDLVWVESIPMVAVHVIIRELVGA